MSTFYSIKYLRSGSVKSVACSFAEDDSCSQLGFTANTNYSITLTCLFQKWVRVMEKRKYARTYQSVHRNFSNHFWSTRLCSNRQRQRCEKMQPCSGLLPRSHKRVQGSGYELLINGDGVVNQMYLCKINQLVCILKVFSLVKPKKKLKT